MSPVAESIIERLDAARQKWWLVSLLTTVVLALCASFGTAMVFMLADSLLQLPQIVLAMFFLIWTAMTLTILFGVGRRLLRGQRSLEATARRVEAEFPELESHLINLVQLAEESNRNVDQRFCQAAVNHAASQIGNAPFDRAPENESRWRRFLCCMQLPRDLIESCVLLVVLLVAAFFLNLWLPSWGSAGSRLLAPWKFVPSIGSVEITNVTPGNTDILVGQSLEISAEIKNPEAKPYSASLWVSVDGEAETQLQMTADESQQHFKQTVPSILKPLKYRLEIGDSQTKVYEVRVREKPVVEAVDVTFKYPAYLGRKDESISQKTLDLEAPQYTQVELRFHASTPVAKGYVEADGQRYLGKVEDDGNILTASMPLLKNGSYIVSLTNDAGHSDPNPRPNRITVIPDKSPTVELLKPARQATASPGAEVAVMIRAADDHGLQRLRLEIKTQASPSENGSGNDKKNGDEAAKADSPTTVVQQWNDFSGDSITTAVRHCTLELKTETYKPGQTVLIRAVATDKRLVADWGLDIRPQETAGGWHSIKIVAEDAKASAALEQIENLRGTLSKILEKQIQARASAGVLSPKKGKNKPAEDAAKLLSDRVRAAGNVRVVQVDIQKTATDLVKSIRDTDREERLAIKRVLNGLAFGDMLQAVTLSESMAKLKSPEAFDKPASELITAQDRIIDVLRKMLDVTRRAQSDVLAEMKKKPGSDLPDDVRQKLNDVRSKLDKFLEQQKKVIEATENLAKTPVEDFSKEQEEALKGLAAAEDQWAKFMKDLHSDLSKIPEQDFANSSMIKETAEIQVELKMAEDELLKKSADIAVPIEQLGAEKAEEIKTNIEKWLYEKPDRLKWSQEEPLTDNFKEAPMAELPGQLEDMIGELADQEEDLFDEMEDVTSSWTDSMDKGAGWDAMDGPISNMSAKGVTGNALPNSSEINGRSGEGRQGKASGEFVGDEAIGKGGRRTPSRLTPDPYVKGQIKDHSKQSAGGATGGGKESGTGGEGLEGPGRAPSKKKMERMASKQATLRNKAEAVDLQFQVSNFHHTDLKKMIDSMSQIERDLKAGRYQNALRQRQSIANTMSNVKQYMEGEFQVRQDATSNLPTDIQKEILGSMQDPSPSGWEDLNRQYFERLSSGGDATSADKPAEKPAEKPVDK
jgi:hypothetical protein